MKYQILEKLIPAFEEKIAKFQRKFGKDSITYTKSEPYFEKKIDNYGSKYYVKVIDVEVEGHYQIEGYEFVASLEYIDEIGKNLVKKAPNTEEIPEIYYTRTKCDHCEVDRFRKYTILLKNKETGEYIQVGKGCLREFLGVDIERSAAWFAFWDSIEDYIEEINKSHNNNFDKYYNLDDILEQTIAQKNVAGYISKAMVKAWMDKNCDPETDYYPTCPFTTTASIVWDIITEQKDNKTGKLIQPRYEVTDEIKEEVIKVKEFILNAETNDYLHNLKALLELKEISMKEIGLTASMVGYYIRENKKLEENNKPEIEKSNFVGNVGDKITITAKPECVFSSDSQYGMVYIYKFMQGKDIFTWKTNKDLQNVELTITGTIKAHNEYRGNKQTELTRCKTKILCN